MDPIRDASIDKTMQGDEITHEEASKFLWCLDAWIYEGIDESIRKYLRLLKGLQRDSTHRKIWKIMKRLIEEEDYDGDESIDAAVNERKFLLQRMLTYTVVIDNSNMDMNNNCIL